MYIEVWVYCTLKFEVEKSNYSSSGYQKEFSPWRLGSKQIVSVLCIHFMWADPHVYFVGNTH